jgi:hypothetical protein
MQRFADIRPDGETGRRKGLKIPRPQGYAGSIPAPGTKMKFWFEAYPHPHMWGAIPIALEKSLRFFTAS